MATAVISTPYEVIDGVPQPPLDPEVYACAQRWQAKANAASSSAPEAADPEALTKRKHTASATDHQQRLEQADVQAIVAAASVAAYLLKKPLPLMDRSLPDAAAKDLVQPLLRMTVEVLKTSEVVTGWDGKAPWLHGGHATETVARHLTRYLQLGTTDPKAWFYEPRGPRHPIPTDVLHECIKAVVTDSYHSKRDALGDCALLQSTAEQYGCSLDYLWRAMQAADPSFGCKVQYCKLEFEPDVKQKRLNYIRDWVADSASQRANLHNVIWIDQKLVYLEPGKLRVYTSKLCKQAPSVIEYGKLKRAKGKATRIYYYAAVNARRGGVLIINCTGTQGIGADPVRFQVSLTVPGLLNACVNITKHTTLGSLAAARACASLPHHSRSESA